MQIIVIHFWSDIKPIWLQASSFYTKNELCVITDSPNDHALKQIMPHVTSLEKQLVIVHRCLCKVLRMPNSLLSHHFAPINVCFVTWQRPTMVDVPIKHNCKLHVSKGIVFIIIPQFNRYN
jgi:hypothetical protein